MAVDEAPGPVLPGTRLHGWLERVVSPDTQMRVVAPVLADYQKEMAAAASSGPKQRATLRARWMAALAAALVLDLASHPASEAERAQHRRLWSGVALACGAVTALQVSTILAGGSPLSAVPPSARASLALNLVLDLLPGALAVGLPAGVLLGALACTPSLKGRRRPLALAGAGAAIAVLLLLAFVVPWSNQAYRVDTWQAITAATVHAVPEKGVREMSFGELQQNAARYRSIDRPAQAATYEVERHRRLALSAACVVLVWFAAGLAGTALATSLLRRLAVTVAVATLYVGLFDWGSHLATSLTVDSPAPVWIPNFVFLGLAAALQLARRGGGVPSVSRG